jgi:hypothetical protein
MLMLDPDTYAGWLLRDRLEMLAFEAELAPLPHSLISTIWDLFLLSAAVASVTKQENHERDRTCGYRQR